MKMHNLKNLNHASTFIELQKVLIQESTFHDVLLVTGDSVVMQAHRFMLGSRSKFFRDIFKSLSSESENEATIIIPDIKSSILKHVLTFIYLGEVSVRSTELKDFIESIDFLGFNNPLSFEFKKSNYTPLKVITCKTENCGVIEVFPIIKSEEDVDEKEANLIGNWVETEFDNYFYDENEDINKTQITEENMENVDQEVSEDVVIGDETYSRFNESNNSDTDDDNEESKSQTRKLLFYSDKLLSIKKRQHENLEKAVAYVIDEGISLKKASELCSVSKSVLCRKVKHNPDYRMNRTPLIQSAIEKLTNGETLKGVSQALSIPISTLQRYKMKLYKQGRLPENIIVRKRNTSEDFKLRISQAVQACLEGMSQNQSAALYNISKTTLYRHFRKISPRVKKFKRML